MSLSIIRTADKSPTLYVSELDEHYHSTFGALTESRHVYVDCGLLHRAKDSQEDTLKVFEVGFGTGLNAALTAMTGQKVSYAAIEKYPLNREITDKLDFSPCVDRSVLVKIHEAPWNEPVRLSENFTIHKIESDFLSYIPAGTYDVIFMDAFAPDKQPEMWTPQVISKIASMLSPRGVVTTYCAKGDVRRAFQACGLIVERLPGPEEGKREILRATKMQ